MVYSHSTIVNCISTVELFTDEKTYSRKLPVTGVVKLLVLPIVIGAEVVILPQFTMQGLLSTIERYQIAEVQVVPPIIIRLVRDPLVSQYDLSCIKRFASGAAPISKCSKLSTRHGMDLVEIGRV